MEVDFGEILEPVSRAFWDDYDDLAENAEFKLPEWNAEAKDVVCPGSVKTCLVIEGHKVEELTKLLLLKSLNPIAKLKSGKVSLFYLPDMEVVLCVSEEKNLNNYGPITELLKPFIEKTPEVVSISIQPSSLHRGPKEGDSDKVSFVRGIDSALPDILPLQEPNFITGVAAGVASWRKFKDLQTPCYVIYVESLRFDSETIEPLVRILEKLGIHCSSGNINIKTSDSNLYM
uniref:Proteasome assembly chaperone 1 n=1 Tax=Phlebotomus kandelakii TaxID=1109342 RepID=A0A6B2EAJ8_9DIPT